MAPASDRWPEEYERGRPGWPSDVVELPGVPPDAKVLDLGAGTGKLTRVLVTRFPHVAAVEPDDRMRALLEALVPDAQALAGSAERIPLADDSVDAVFAAEAFHWFASDRALSEAARVLRPRGALVLMWNLPAGPTEPAIAAVEELLRARGPTREELGVDPIDLNTTFYASGDWRAPFPGSPFEALQEARVPNHQTVDREGLMAFFASMGWIDGLPDEERVRLLDDVKTLLGAEKYHRQWETHICWTRLAG